MITKNKNQLKFWNMVSVDETHGEIILYGDVLDRTPVDFFTGEPVDDLFITPKGFNEDLEKIKDKDIITIRINSGGGILDTGIAIGNTIKGLKSKTIGIAEGFVGSAATLILCSCDVVKAYRSSEIMIHEAKGEMEGSYSKDDLLKSIESFDCAEKSMVEIYKDKTGLSEEEIKELIKAETWMTGIEAKELGFVDVLIEDEEAEPQFELQNKKILLVNGVKHNISGYHIPPKVLKRLKNKNSDKTGGKQMAFTMKKLQNFFLKGLAMCNEAEEQEDELLDEENLEEQEEQLPPATNKKNKKNSDEDNLENEDDEELENEDDEDLECEDDEELENEDEEEVVNLKNLSPKARKAVLKERKRLQSIDKIAGTIQNKKLVTEAKYGKRACSAATLAYRSLEAHKKINRSALNNLETDFLNSGAQKVKSLGNSGTSGKPDAKTEAARTAQLYTQLKGGRK